MSDNTNRSSGRWLYLFGVLLFFSGIVVYFVQFLAMRQLIVPWYIPIMATVGLLVILFAVYRRGGILRYTGLVLAFLMTALIWFFIVVLVRVPPYQGPKPGESMPEFSIADASGETFTNKDLANGKPTVLVFFRGRW